MTRAELSRLDLVNWEAEYQAAKYPDALYEWGLRMMRDCVCINPDLALAVHWLFLWKLGKVSRKKSPTSNMRIEIDGNCYFASGTTVSNNAAIEKAMSPSRLARGLQFRDGALSFTAFSTFADELTAGSLVLPAFYCHIFRPEEFPIIDINIWRSMRVLAPHLSRRSIPRDWSDYFLYARFFTDLARDFSISPRSLDKALWVWRGGGTNNPGEVSTGRVVFEQTVRPSNVSLPSPSVLSKLSDIPYDLRSRLIRTATEHGLSLPLKIRGITITPELACACLEVLNATEGKSLPQNNRNAVLAETPDGLDARIKARTGGNLRTANIVSDLLAELEIVEVYPAPNWVTQRQVKWTRLKTQWHW